jgi:hypothetical protein
MEKAKIIVGKNLNGYGFRLAPETRWRVQELGGHPAHGLFLSSDFRDDFMTYHGGFLRNVFPALAGFVDPRDAERFDLVEFVDFDSNSVMYAWSQREGKEMSAEVTA